MITEFDSAFSSSLTDGKYILASALYMALIIEEGKPFRDDFLHHDQSNRARCCNEARAFLLIDPTTSRTSTYVQLNTNLIIELSHNHRGCVHLWRRQVDWHREVNISSKSLRLVDMKDVYLAGRVSSLRNLHIWCGVEKRSNWENSVQGQRFSVIVDTPLVPRFCWSDCWDLQRFDL